MPVGSVLLFSRWNEPTDAFARVTMALARGLGQSGACKVTVAVLRSGDCPLPEVPAGVNLVPLKANRLRWAAPELARYLKQERPDYLISMPSTASIFAYVATRLAGKDRPKFVINQADTLFSEVSIEHVWNPDMRALTWLAKFLYPRADALVATTPEVMGVLNRNGIRHAHTAIIPNPVDLELIDRAAPVPEPRLTSLLSPDLPNVVSLGRLVRRKNFDLLIDAMQILKSRGKRARLVIIGDGPDRVLLEKRIAAMGLQDVVLAGFVENAWSVVAKSDVFVMSSEDEAFCLALAEAMACDVPVVSTDAIGGGPRELLMGGRLAPLVPRNNPIALADAIAGRLCLGEEQKKAVTSAARCSLSRYEPTAIAAQWLQLLQSLSTPVTN